MKSSKYSYIVSRWGGAKMGSGPGMRLAFARQHVQAVACRSGWLKFEVSERCRYLGNEGTKMLKSMVACAIGLVALVTVFPVRAEFVDGKTLAEWAGEYQRVRSGTGDYLSHIYDRRFQVYILGVHDAYTESLRASTTDQLFCTPMGTTVAGVSVVVYKYLQNNPGLSHESGSAVVVSALAEAFPCSDQ